MKKLLDLPLHDVMSEIGRLPVTKPITVQQGLYYLMFIEAISEDLVRVNNEPSHIMLERITEVARLHGGLVEYDVTKDDEVSLMDKMLHNSSQGVLFTRLTYMTARLLAD